jgi:23S rRNA (guanosine2251-2'-O)-methyltransferase
VALVVAPRRWATLDEIIARARERGEPPFVLVLDSLEDPQNVGTLLRTAEACGIHGVLFPTRRAAPMSPAAVKASAGAIEHLLLCPTDDLAAALADLRGAGLRLIGADEGAALPYRESDLRGPLALVVGSEAHGLSGAVRRRLDATVRLPMRGRVASLNAAVAGSVLLFEAASQRELRSPDPTSDKSRPEEPRDTEPRDREPRDSQPRESEPADPQPDPSEGSAAAKDDQAELLPGES